MAVSSATPASLYNPQFMDHVNYPDYNYQMENATHVHEGVNPSCGDELTFSVRVEEGRIAEAAYQGHGCAISQASADMMSDLITGRSVEEALGLCDLFKRMVTGQETDDGALAVLEDAALLKDISHMPARVKCAELAWRTLSEMLDGGTAGAGQAASQGDGPGRATGPADGSGQAAGTEGEA